MPTEPARPSDVVMPTQPVRPREGAVVDRTVIHLTMDAAAKENAFPSDGGRSRGIRFTHAVGDRGDLFVFDGVIYQVSVATRGSVDARPDARAVQYRLYCEQDAQVYTDGLPHWCELRTDAAGGCA